MLKKQQKRYKRHKKIRVKVFGTAEIPRFSVFRSSKHICAQLVDDEKGKTVVTASDLEFKSKRQKTGNKKQEVKKKELKGKIRIAYQVGELTAEKAFKKKIKKVVFDRGGFAYHGRVKALAEEAREGGLHF